nr:unnamed protein product [Callosobruchus analis]
MNSDKREWIVVHFTDEDTVKAVPRVWYISEHNVCTWPPRHLRRFLTDLSKKKEIPEDWPTFPAKIFGQYDDFQMAKRKALKAQDTTDLSSNTETPSRKRRFKQIQKNKFLSSDSEDDKDDDENIYPSVPIKNSVAQLNLQPQDQKN